jgi:hypothetical protein
MLEGGADWGARVYIHLVDRWHKRSRAGLVNYDPASLDRREFSAHFARYGCALSKGRSIEGEDLVRDTLGERYVDSARQPRPDELEDFAAAGIESVEDIKRRWVDCFFFGSESDDRTVAHAFNDRANPLGVKINAIYSSDVGHWDVPDLTQVLAESYALVEEGAITEQDFKAWVFDNPYKLYTEATASFFRGTAVEQKLKLKQQQQQPAAHAEV